MSKPTTKEDITIVRASHGIHNHYFYMSRAAAQDNSLSFEAIGALAYLLSKPDDWVVRNKDLEKFGKPSKIKRIIKELTNSGYLSKPERIRDPKTKKFTGWTPRKVHETPIKTVSAKTEGTGNRKDGKPKVRENDHIHNTEVLENTEVTKTTLQDEPASEKTEPEKLFEDQDLILAIKEQWGKLRGCTPTIDEAPVMFSESEYNVVKNNAIQNYKKRNATKTDNMNSLMNGAKLPMYNSIAKKFINEPAAPRIERDINDHHNVRSAILEPLQAKSERDELAEAIVQDTEAEQATIKTEAKAKKDTVPASQMNPMKDAIVQAFSFDPDKLTRREWSNISGVAKSLCLVKAKPEDIEHLHAHCAKKFTMFGVNALETNYSSWNVTQSKTTDYETQKQIARDMWAEQNGIA